MSLETFLNHLFPEGHQVQTEDWLIKGEANVSGETVAVLGTLGNASIGILECVRLSDEMLDIIATHPGRSIIMLVDNEGQRMALSEELLALPQYIGHLIKVQHLAREKGHKLIAIVTGHAIAGGFIAFGMQADRVVAIKGAQTSVMKLDAIARVTKQPLARLEEMARTVPVFAPGPENFYKMGGLDELWEEDYGSKLALILAGDTGDDNRAVLGAERGGRTMAAMVINRVIHG